jgi:hypothetical protein
MSAKSGIAMFSIGLHFLMSGYMRMVNSAL